MMPRFLVNVGGRSMRLYYPTISEAWDEFPDAESITEYTNTKYLEFVSEIEKLNTETKLDYRGREIWKIPYNGSYILYRQYTDCGDYIDGCCYQRYDNLFGTMPITWDCSEPEEFYNKFCKPHKELPIEIISSNELKKLKVKPFWNRNSVKYYKDTDGYFYFVDKHDLPSRKNREEYFVFGGNENAVYVKYGVFCSPAVHYKWFWTEKDFLDFWKEYEPMQNPAFGTAQYEITKRGYTLIEPNDRRVIFRLPYFDLDMELKYNSEIECATAWAKNMGNYNQFGDFDQNRELCLDLIKRYTSNTSDKN